MWYFSFLFFNSFNLQFTRAVRSNWFSSHGRTKVRWIGWDHTTAERHEPPSRTSSHDQQRVHWHCGRKTLRLYATCRRWWVATGSSSEAAHGLWQSQVHGNAVRDGTLCRRQVPTRALDLFRRAHRVEQVRRWARAARCRTLRQPTNRSH